MVLKFGRSPLSIVPDATNSTNLALTKKNLGNINRQLPVSAIDSILPVGIGTKQPTNQAKFKDTNKDPAQNFLSPISKGVVKGAS